MSFDPTRAEIKALKDLNMTFSGIRPKHIVGFSKVITSDTLRPKVIYRAQRTILKDNVKDDEIQSQVEAVIKNLQNTKLKKGKKHRNNNLLTNVDEQKVLTFNAFKAIRVDAKKQYAYKLAVHKKKGKLRHKDIHWINSYGVHAEGLRPPLFEINSPTLFVFTTSYPSDYTQRIGGSSYIYPDSGYGFDPSFQNPMYVVNDGRVLLVFSDFDYEKTPQKIKEYWFNLRFTFKYTDRFKKKVYIMNNPTHTFDPGTGSGSGQGFP